MSHAERNEAILRLYAEGYTSPAIAKHLGITRNTVVGVVFRAKKSGQETDPKKVHKTSKVAASYSNQEAPLSLPSLPVAKVVVPPAPPCIKAPETATTRIGVTITRLRANGCRYPVGYNQRGQHLFCNAPQGKSSYCLEHHSIVFVPPTKKNIQRICFAWRKLF